MPKMNDMLDDIESIPQVKWIFIKLNRMQLSTVVDDGVDLMV